MTGTKDVTPIGVTDAKERLTVYPALHAAPKYQVVLDNADHSVFADRAFPGDRNTNHHRVSARSRPHSGTHICGTTRMHGPG